MKHRNSSGLMLTGKSVREPTKIIKEEEEGNCFWFFFVKMVEKYAWGTFTNTHAYKHT